MLEITSHKTKLGHPSFGLGARDRCPVSGSRGRSGPQHVQPGAQSCECPVGLGVASFWADARKGRRSPSGTPFGAANGVPPFREERHRPFVIARCGRIAAGPALQVLHDQAGGSLNWVLSTSGTTTVHNWSFMPPRIGPLDPKGRKPEA